MSGSSAGTSEVINKRKDGPSSEAPNSQTEPVGRRDSDDPSEANRIQCNGSASSLGSTNGVRRTHQNPRQEGLSLGSEIWLSPRTWSGLDLPDSCWNLRPTATPPSEQLVSLG